MSSAMKITEEDETEEENPTLFSLLHPQLPTEKQLSSRSQGLELACFHI